MENVSNYGEAAQFPLVEFKTLEGKRVSFVSGIGAYPPDYQPNEEVAVLYDPSNEKNAQIRSWKHLWFAPALFIFIGFLPMMIGAFAVWKIRSTYK